MSSLMGPLLEYQRQPIQYQIESQQHRLELHMEDAGFDHQTAPFKMEMQSANSQFQQDSFEYRASIGRKSIMRVIDEEAQRSVQAQREIVAQKVEFANSAMHIEKGADIRELFFQQYMDRVTGGSLAFVPTTPIEISFTDPQLNQQFTPQQVDFQWTPPVMERNYVPGGCTLNIQQYPSLSMTYTGDFNYVPRRLDTYA